MEIFYTTAEYSLNKLTLIKKNVRKLEMASSVTRNVIYVELTNLKTGL